MKKIKLYMTIFLIFPVVYGCSKSTTKLDEVDMSQNTKSWFEII